MDKGRYLVEFYSQKYIYATAVFARLVGIEKRLSMNLTEAPYYSEIYNLNGVVTSTKFLREGLVQILPGITYQYNSNGKIFSATAPDGGVTTYTYSTLPGQEDLVAYEIDASAHIIYHDYDSMNREIKVFGDTCRLEN